MKKIALILTLVVVIVSCVALEGCTATSVENMIGTVIQLKIEGMDSKSAEREIHEMIRRVEKSVSTNREDSLMNTINRAKVGEVVALDDTTNEMIEASVKYYELSGGAFDISVFPLVDLWQFSPSKVNTISKEPPKDEDIAKTQELVGFSKAFTYDSEKKTIRKNIEGARLDLGAVAKGYIADKANDILNKKKIKQAIVDIGGTIYLNGDRTFKVGVKHPRPEKSDDYLIKVLELEKVGISTSGDYERYYMDPNTNERYHHIIDPRTGRPAKNGLVSVTIVSKSAMLTDILSTTVFVLGKEKGIELLQGIEEVDMALLISEIDGELIMEEYHKDTK